MQLFVFLILIGSLISGCAQPKPVIIDKPTSEVIVQESDLFRISMDRVLKQNDEKVIDSIYTKAFHEMR